VTGRKSGRAVSHTVWFAFDEDEIYLLPVRGSATQGYKNVSKNRSIRVEARGPHAKFKAVPLTRQAQVKSAIEKIRTKYGAGDGKQYYAKFDVAVVAQME